MEAQHKLHNTTRPSDEMANETDNKDDTKLLIHDALLRKENADTFRYDREDKCAGD